MRDQKYNIRIKAYDPRAADHAAALVVGVAKNAEVEVVGPMPLPTRKVITTVLRSTHINKTSREQFELSTHKRLIRLNLKKDELKVVENIERLELPAGASLLVMLARKFNAKNRQKKEGGKE